MYWVKARDLIKCPYYVSHSEPRGKYYPTITCQSLPGMEKSSTLVMKFKGQKEHSDFMEARCMSCYYDCPLFRAIAEAEEKEEYEKRRKDVWKRKRD